MFERLRSFVARVFRAETSGTTSPARWLVDFFGGNKADSGVTINAVTGLQYPPVWQGVRTYAGDVGMLPLVLYRRLPGGDRERARGHPSYRRTLRRPNRLMTPIVWKELLTYHAVWHGNGRAFISRNGRGDVEELIPLLPDRTVSVLVNSEKFHVTKIKRPGSEDPKSRMSGQQFNPAQTEPDEIHVLADRDVLHLVGFGFDGVQGWSLYEHFRDSIGLGLGAEKHTSFTFANKGVPAMVLEAPAGVFRSEEDAKRFLANFNEFHRGLDNTAKTGLLREGIKAHLLQTNARDAQLEQLRKLQRTDAASLLNLPPHKVGSDERISYNSLEQENLAYLTHSLMYWLVKWQDECNEKLLTERQKSADSHFFEFLTAALLRGDLLSRYQAYQIGRASEFLSANDVRQMENLNQIEGGDEYRNPNTRTGDDTGGDTGDDGTDEGVTDQVRGLIRARLSELADVERSRVLAAAERENNFVDWLDRFYAGWRSTLARAIESVGGAVSLSIDSQQLAQAHCERQREWTLELAGQHTSETLAEAIRSVENYRSAAAVLADEICSAQG